MSRNPSRSKSYVEVRWPRAGESLNASRPHRIDTKVVSAVGAAAALAGAAAYVQMRTREAETDNPPRGQFVEVDGVRLHYTERGMGEPLVLLHGNGALVEDFATSGLIDLAAQRYRVITFDRPGYGYSERPRWRVWTPEAQAALFVEAFRRLGIERPVVLGHSWGTQVALALGLDWAQSVRSLVLLSGYYYPSVRVDAALLSPPAIPVLGDLLRYTVSPLIGRLTWPMILRKLFGPNPTPRHFQRFPKWMVLRPGQIRASAEESALMVPAAARLSRRYRELTPPVVIMAGGADRVVAMEDQSLRLHDELQGSGFHAVPGAGHMIHHIVPDAVLEAIDEAAERGAARLGAAA